MSFQDMVKADAAACLDDAESVTCYPAGFPDAATPQAYAASVLVERGVPSKFGATPRAMSTETKVWLPKSVQTTKPTLDLFAIAVSGFSDPLRVVRIDNEHDPGFWQLVVN